MVHGLNFNLALNGHNFNWLTVARANSLVAPLQAMAGGIASNAWKHAYIMPKTAQAVAVLMQTSSYSARALGLMFAEIKTNYKTMWPSSAWGPTTLLSGGQVLMLG
ncbi:hypothetical protein H632_c617p0, partial [Helicosporidium sp. ATCC 50920]